MTPQISLSNYFIVWYNWPNLDFGQLTRSRSPSLYSISSLTNRQQCSPFCVRKIGKIMSQDSHNKLTNFCWTKPRSGLGILWIIGPKTGKVKLVSQPLSNSLLRGLCLTSILVDLPPLCFLLLRWLLKQSQTNCATSSRFWATRQRCQRKILSSIKNLTTLYHQLLRKAKYSWIWPFLCWTKWRKRKLLQVSPIAVLAIFYIATATKFFLFRLTKTSLWQSW